MTWRRIGLYWACWLGLSAYYGLVERPREPRASPVKRAPFLSVPVEQISGLEIRRGAVLLRCRRVGERWQLEDPTGHSVPPDLVSALIDNLSQLPDVEVVADAHADLAPFGLAPPASQITLLAANGAQLSVRLGNRNPAGTAVYATRSGSDRVYLIGLNVRYYADLLVEAAGLK